MTLSKLEENRKQVAEYNRLIDEAHRKGDFDAVEYMVEERNLLELMAKWLD